MLYAPHILQLKVVTPPEKDEYNRPVEGTGGESWQTVCKCKCYDDATQELVSPNADVYHSRYRIVCEPKPLLKEGDEVRVLKDGNIRACGIIGRCSYNDYLPYNQYWL